MKAGLTRGYRLAAENPDAALDGLLGSADGLDDGAQAEQMAALSKVDAFAAGVRPGEFDPERFENWKSFARANGIPVPEGR
jgi:hypothetical protein